MYAHAICLYFFASRQTALLHNLQADHDILVCNILEIGDTKFSKHLTSHVWTNADTAKLWPSTNLRMLKFHKNMKKNTHTQFKANFSPENKIYMIKTNAIYIEQTILRNVVPT